MARPRTYNENMTPISLFMPVSLAEIIRDEAKNNNTSLNKYLLHVIFSRDTKLTQELLSMYNQLLTTLKENREIIANQLKEYKKLRADMFFEDETVYLPENIQEIINAGIKKFLATEYKDVDSWTKQIFDEIEAHSIEFNNQTNEVSMKTIKKPTIIKSIIKSLLKKSLTLKERNRGWQEKMEKPASQ